jgi:DNA-binding CsgD family transcriptional regulator
MKKRKRCEGFCPCCGQVHLKEHHRQFLRYVCEDLTYVEIAEKMFKSPRTIEGYTVILCEILSVNTRAGLIMYAIRNGIYEVKTG